MYATASARNKFMSDGMGTTPPERLLVMLYDRLLRDLDEAEAAIGQADIGAAHDALTHAQDIVAELHSALDLDAWDGAPAMAELYTWLGELLAQANMKKSVDHVNEARSLVKPLRDTWDEAYQAMAAASAPASVGAGAAASTSAAAFGQGGPRIGGLDVSG